MKTCFVVNPSSGKGSQALGTVREFAAARSAPVNLTAHRGHARELASAAVADGFEVVVAVGGDGTLNEVASALTGTSVILGLVSCGSGNGLGRHLGTHGSVRRSLNIVANGVPRRIDTGYVGDWPFFNLAGLGFEAELAEHFNRLRKRGLPRYAIATLADWGRRRSRTFTIEAAGATRTVTALGVTIANGTQFGNNVKITPSARIDDGLLDLVAMPELGIASGVAALWHLMRGTFDQNPALTRIRSSQFCIRQTPGGLVHVDGETHPAPDPVEITIRPLSLQILVPV